MNYFEFTFAIKPADPGNEILMARLFDLGFEGFAEEKHLLKGYVSSDIDHLRKAVKKLLNLSRFDASLLSVKRIENQNWNQAWESSFHPVLIDGKCRVRAAFHEPAKEAEFDIVIQPKMSFGTGHHETTFLMSRQLLKMDLKGKNVLDMGCGTGVLAILTSFKGANKVTAVDVDNWAYENASENIQRNKVCNVDVKQGGVEILADSYQLIMANINKNVILEDLKIYSEHLQDGGDILLSGFYEQDQDDILSVCSECNLLLQNSENRMNWMLLHLSKG